MATTDPRNQMEQIRRRYAEAARDATEGRAACDCGTENCVHTDGSRGWAAAIYEEGVVSEMPETAVLASLGCGNPTAVADLREGEAVLDLGSGGGLDAILSARRVGESGTVYGLDMTDEMLALAEANAAEAGVRNVRFLKGEIEAIPLPSESVDVVISNCVINLAADKDRVLAEAFRVLRPGGRFAVSDIVVRGAMPDDIRRSVELWMGCLAGALEESEYRARLGAAGFEAVEIEPTRIYSADDARGALTGAGMDAERIAPLVGDKFMSAFVRARKPAASAASR